MIVLFEEGFKKNTMKISRDLIPSLRDTIERKTNLTLITLKRFLEHYVNEVSDYYDLGPWKKLREEDSDVLILCLVDYQSQTKRKRTPKSAGKIRRDKFKHRHTYNNPLNRIHGFVALEECSTINVGDRNVVSIAVVGSSIFSPFRGIGSDLMSCGVNVGLTRNLIPCGGAEGTDT